MGDKTAITWCDHTFNPWHGCQRVSEGCRSCYAEAFDHRLGGGHWGPQAPRKFFGDTHWAKPLRWAKRARDAGVRRRVFCASMADVFEDRPDLHEHRQRLFQIIQVTPELDWLLLTKRPEEFRATLPWTTCRTPAEIARGSDLLGHQPWPNVWLGVTAEDQEHADLRVPILLDTPAAIRFVSYEPALGPVDFCGGGGVVGDWLGAVGDTVGVTDANLDAPDGARLHGWERSLYQWRRYAAIDWVVAGDESGHHRRPAQLDWFRSVRDQCQQAGTRFHLKQLHPVDPAVAGARTRDGKIHLPVLDGRRWAESPQ